MSIISDFKMEIKIKSSIIDMLNDRTLNCLFVLINVEVLCKWSLKTIEKPLQNIFKVLLLSLISKYSLS